MGEWNELVLSSLFFNIFLLICVVLMRTLSLSISIVHHCFIVMQLLIWCLTRGADLSFPPVSLCWQDKQLGLCSPVAPNFLQQASPLASFCCIITSVTFVLFY